MTTPRWKNAPPGSHWGEFGANDTRGRMNLVNEAKVLQGVAAVKVGKTFCLSLQLDVPGQPTLNPRRMPPRRYSVLRDGASAGQQGFCWSCQSEDPELTDVVTDGVAEAVFYNGYRAACAPAQPLLADRATAAPARCGGVSGYADCNRVQPAPLEAAPDRVVH
jgi:hypothetical protein